MKRLNYFNPYETKLPHHEDNLTRAFLVLLRYSFTMSHLFYDLCYENFSNCNTYEKNSEKLPSFLDLIDEDINYETQKGNPKIDTNYLASILITDKELTNSIVENKNIEGSDRNARYDGVITYGEDLTFIIEVKPRSENVWFDELKPSKENLSEDTEVLKYSIKVFWKDIISILNLVLKNPSISGQDKLMISDFLDYIDEEFPYLNPYDNFELCNNNNELIIRRIENILKNIVNEKIIEKDINIVKYHYGWGNIIKVSDFFKEIKMIGLIVNKNFNSDNWKLSLSISFGVSVPQARALYEHNLIENFNKSNLIEEKWEINPEFRLTYRGSKLLDIQQGNLKTYIEYFRNNRNEIGQFKRKEVKSQLEKLNDNKVLIFDKEFQDRFDNKFSQKKYDKADFIPGINLRYEISDEEAIKLDSKGEFSGFLVNKIREAFVIIGDQSDKLDELFKDNIT